MIGVGNEPRITADRGPNIRRRTPLDRWGIGRAVYSRWAYGGSVIPCAGLRPGPTDGGVIEVPETRHRSRPSRSMEGPSSK